MAPTQRFDFDPAAGTIPGRKSTYRLLSDMRGYFVDTDAYVAACAQGDPVLYSMTAFEPNVTDGTLWSTIVCVKPGKIGHEYYMTKGHFHAWRPASEYYVCLRGNGLMLFEDEATGESRTVSMRLNSAVYIPGHTAHRTINVGDEPLTYLCFYSHKAGHDYGAIAERNFHQIVVEVDGAPVVMARNEVRHHKGTDTTPADKPGFFEKPGL